MELRILCRTRISSLYRDGNSSCLPNESGNECGRSSFSSTKVSGCRWKRRHQGAKVGLNERFVSHLQIKIACSRSRGECANSWIKPAPLLGNLNVSRDRSHRTLKCGAFKGRHTAVETYEYDLYELLGIEKDARAEEIKRAYRWLQKRCHPDVAGAMGHDMAILLNDAYSVLSDPDKRATYDATCQENKDLQGFTGAPIYSCWYGSKEEDRAVFVEETRCIGCLKCALIAPDTFSIESKFGRARCQNQWLDNEPTIQDAIRACPVDCIWMVKKDMLPALEFIMSKQPRLLASLRNRNYVGARQESVFTGARRLLKKHVEREKRKASFQETPAQRASRMAAAESIHIKAGQWWRNFVGNSNIPVNDLRNNIKVSQGTLIHIPMARSTGNRKFVDNYSSAQYQSGHNTDLGPLLEAVRRRRKSPKVRNSAADHEEEYWTPVPALTYSVAPEEIKKPEPNSEVPTTVNSVRETPKENPVREKFRGNVNSYLDGLFSAFPIAVAVAAAVLVGINVGSNDAHSETDFFAGPIPSSVSSGLAMQMFLTAIVWYAIGVVICTGAMLMTNAFVASREKQQKE